MIKIQRDAYFLWAVLLLTIPLPWIIAFTAASLIHELGHILSVVILGGEIRCITVGTGGAVIYGRPMVPWKALICSLAGPICGGLLIILFPSAPRLALCALIQTLYNLLPVTPLDGGRALGYFTIMTVGHRIMWLDTFFETIIVMLVLVLSIKLKAPGLNLLLVPLLREKLLANSGKKGYNSAAKQEQTLDFLQMR